MALQMKKTYPSGVTLEESYLKVRSIQFNQHEQIVYIDLATYKDITARQNNQEPVEVLTYSIYPDQFPGYFAVSEMDKININVIKQCYRVLKTLNEFSTAIDV